MARAGSTKLVPELEPAPELSVAVDSANLKILFYGGVIVSWDRKENRESAQEKFRNAQTSFSEWKESMVFKI